MIKHFQHLINQNTIDKIPLVVKQINIIEKTNSLIGIMEEIKVGD